MDSKISSSSLVQKAADLISLPEIYLKVRELLDDPNSSLADIADVINVDPNLTSRILRIANSAYCGFKTKIETANRAINMLGTQQIHDLVLSTSVAKAFSSIPEEIVNMEKFWRCSVICGASAKVIADSCNILDSERMFTAGLLAHIGRLVLFMSLPKAIEEAYAQAFQGDVTIAQAIENQLGFSDAKVAGDLLSHWKLPDTLVNPIRYQTYLEISIEDLSAEEVAIVHVASAIADMHEFQLDTDVMITSLNEAAWNVLELDRDKLLDLIDDAESLSNEITEQFLPEPA